MFSEARFYLMNSAFENQPINNLSFLALVESYPRAACCLIHLEVDPHRALHNALISLKCLSLSQSPLALGNAH